MTVKEYLNQFKNYSYYQGCIPLILLSDYTYFEKDNKEYCTCTFKQDGLKYGCFKTNLDGRILHELRHSIDYQIQLRTDLLYIWKRLDYLFNHMLQVNDNNLDRELVLLRIAINMIDQLDMDFNDRIQWTEWLRELFWKRKSIFNEWYIKYVLPF